MMWTALQTFGIIRAIKIGAGAGLMVYWFSSGHPEYGLVGGMLLLQGVFNTCCGTAACTVDQSKKSVSKNEDIIYEEVK